VYELKRKNVNQYRFKLQHINTKVQISGNKSALLTETLWRKITRKNNIEFTTSKILPLSWFSHSLHTKNIHRIHFITPTVQGEPRNWIIF